MVTIGSRSVSRVLSIFEGNYANLNQWLLMLLLRGVWISEPAVVAIRMGTTNLVGPAEGQRTLIATESGVIFVSHSLAMNPKRTACIHGTSRSGY